MSNSHQKGSKLSPESTTSPPISINPEPDETLINLKFILDKAQEYFDQQSNFFLAKDAIVQAKDAIVLERRENYKAVYEAANYDDNDKKVIYHKEELVEAKEALTKAEKQREDAKELRNEAKERRNKAEEELKQAKEATKAFSKPEEKVKKVVYDSSPDPNNQLMCAYCYAFPTLLPNIETMSSQLIPVLTTAKDRFTDLLNSSYEVINLERVCDIFSGIDTAFDTIQSILCPVPQEYLDNVTKSTEAVWRLFGRGDQYLGNNTIISPISVMYTSIMLQHMIPLSTANNLQAFKSKAPNLFALAEIASEYLTQCSFLMPYSNLSIVLSRTLSLVGLPGIGKSRWLYIAAFFALELNIPVDIISSPENIFEFYSFPNNIDPPTLHKYPDAPPLPEIDNGGSPEFQTNNAKPIKQLTYLYDFIKSRLCSGFQGLFLVDPPEFSFSHYGSTPTGFFSTLISPLFCDCVAPDIQIGGNEYLPQSFDVSFPITQTSRLISTHSCQKSLTHPIIWNDANSFFKSHKIVSFSQNQQFMTPLPNEYTSTQIKNIFSQTGVSKQVSQKVLDDLEEYSLPSIRCASSFMFLTDSQRDALRDSCLQFHAIPTTSGDHRHSKQIIDFLQKDSLGSSFPHDYLALSLASTFKYHLRMAVDASPSFTVNSLKQAHYEHHTPEVRGSFPEEEAFFTSIITTQSQFYVHHEQPSSRFNKDSGDWYDIRFKFRVPYIYFAYTNKIGNRTYKLTNVIEAIFGYVLSTPSRTMCAFPPRFPLADFCFKIEINGNPHLHLIQISTTYTNRETYEEWAPIFQNAITTIDSTATITFCDYICPSTSPSPNLPIYCKKLCEKAPETFSRVWIPIRVSYDKIAELFCE